MQDVAHTTVTTPVASKSVGGAKRKQAAITKNERRHPEAGARTGGDRAGGPTVRDVAVDKENRRRQGATGGNGRDKEEMGRERAGGDLSKAAKRAKPSGPITSVPPPPSHPQSSPSAPSSSSSSASGAQPASVRYPRLNYAEAVPPTERTFISPDVPDTDKLLYLASRVMEADTLQVERMLMSTKYQHLSHEMEKYAGMVGKRLHRVLEEDARAEVAELGELERLRRERREAVAACDALDEEAGKLRKVLRIWEEMDREMEVEGGRFTDQVGAARAAEMERAEGALASQERSRTGGTETAAGYTSPVTEETLTLLAQGPGIRAHILESAGQLVDALEGKVAEVRQVEEAAKGRQKALAAAFRAVSFAGIPAMGEPAVAVKRAGGGKIK